MHGTAWMVKMSLSEFHSSWKFCTYNRSHWVYCHCVNVHLFWITRRKQAKQNYTMVKKKCNSVCPLVIPILWVDFKEKQWATLSFCGTTYPELWYHRKTFRKYAICLCIPGKWRMLSNLWNQSKATLSGSWQTVLMQQLYCVDSLLFHSCVQITSSCMGMSSVK